MASVRCVDCRVCESVSHHQKPKEVIFCPRQSQYRATAMFRRCDYFVENFTVHYFSEFAPDCAHSQV